MRFMIHDPVESYGKNGKMHRTRGAKEDLEQKHALDAWCPGWPTRLHVFLPGMGMCWCCGWNNMAIWVPQLRRKGWPMGCKCSTKFQTPKRNCCATGSLDVTMTNDS